MALIEFNLDGIIEKYNTDIANVLGYSADELKGSHISILLSSSTYKSDSFRTMWEQIRNGVVQQSEINFLKKDGKTITINGVFTPVLEKEGSTLYNLKSISFDFNILKAPHEKSANIVERGIIENETFEELDDTSNAFLKQLIFENKERLKELAAINQTTKILKEGKPIEETLQQICMLLPKAWQYPEYTVARIIFNKKEFKTPDFIETTWVQKQNFETIDSLKGSIEVFYLKQFSVLDEGPFLKEERHLIDNLATIIVNYLNSLRAKSILKASEDAEPDFADLGQKVSSRQLLHRFLNKQNYDRDVFHDLMPFKVNEILLIANLYDAYYIEKEGRFSEHILGEYYQLNLTSIPRVTGVSTYEEAMAELNEKHYDFVIIMLGVDKNAPLDISKIIRQKFPYIPIFMLLNNNSDIALYERDAEVAKLIDKIFVWNGDSRVFFAMVKYLEDMVNVENDTKIGLVNVILLVEDSAKYYSRYLPMLYSSVLEQTKRLIEDVSNDELYKVLRLRARPKILLVKSYEESIDIFNKYRDYMLCLISDMKFYRNNELDENAGYDLVKYVRDKIKDLPIIIQSSDPENAKLAYELKVTFIDKGSDTLSQDIKSFISHYLGFGNFIYKDGEGHDIAIASSLKEFEKHLKTIPDESLIYHGKRNHFSLWLMARGEISIAKKINPLKTTDFKNAQELRDFLLNAIQNHRNEKNKGKVISFEETDVIDESNIVALSSGSLGGKGRGLAFINTLIYNYDFSQMIPNINIRTPITAIIGTDEFDYFIDRNKLYDFVNTERDYATIRKVFMESKLTESLIKKLRMILRKLTKPLAIRSSGLFEDSLMQPFAGIFETYLIPNNHPNLEIRLTQAMDAIKLVYASVFSKIARGYVEAISYKIEEEKMAVVIQEVVGNVYEDVYYPHISGVAQSYNFYPFSHMKPEEGFAVMAVGLGTYVVEGEKAYRFAPKYADVEINSPKDQYKSSQLNFYAVNLKEQPLNLLKGEDAGLVKLEISAAEKHGTLRHCASVYDSDNNRIVPGLSYPGPRIVNFANILKYHYIPLPETIELVIDVVKEALGSPVEIEFAIDLNKDEKGRASFYLLQIKPLIGNAEDYTIDEAKINKNDVILFSNKGMGNGLINDITDIIYVDISLFDKSHTDEMVCEIESLNDMMIKENRKYILIGPGRWGTRDKWIGIPVNWTQISNAKVIVETSLEDFPLDASSGSHFFHNVTSLKVGYFSVQQELNDSYINWDKLNKAKLINKTKYFRHIRFENTIDVKMDGKKRMAVIEVNKDI
ncbi:MAG: PAS domain-containing protein [Bacteroidetes bacterium]|nr:PAS domain-containing protein [Bacteroidota bacterium]